MQKQEKPQKNPEPKAEAESESVSAEDTWGIRCAGDEARATNGEPVNWKNTNAPNKKNKTVRANSRLFGFIGRPLSNIWLRHYFCFA